MKDRASSPKGLEIEITVKGDSLDTSNPIEAVIRTERLALYSLGDKEKALENYIPLFSHKETMEMFGKGVYDLYYPNDKEGEKAVNKESEDYKLLKTRVDRWVNEWKLGNLSAFAIYKEDQFIGHIVADNELVKEEKDTKVALAILIHSDHQGKGLGQEACSALLHHFIPEMVGRGLSKVKTVEATVRQDNRSSKRMLNILFGKEISNLSREPSKGDLTELYKHERFAIEASVDELARIGSTNSKEPQTAVATANIDSLVAKASDLGIGK